MADEIFVKEPKRKEHNPAGVISVILFIVAIVLAVILFDRLYVPSGDTWEYIKQSYIDAMEYEIPPEDKELWAEMKAFMKEEEAVPIDSGFICWITLKGFYEEEIEQDKIRNEKQTAATESAAELKAFLTECAADFGLTQDVTVQMYFFFRDGPTVYCMPYRSENDYSLSYVDQEIFDFEEYITEKAKALDYPEYSGMAALIKNGVCTAVVFMPDVNGNLELGKDSPPFKEDGTFDYEAEWGWGSRGNENNYIYGFA